jgi:hypothetical protein
MLSEMNKYILASILVLVPFVSLFCSTIVIRYLNAKSFGMQTLLDKFMIELQYAYIFTCFAVNYPMATGTLFSSNLAEPVPYVFSGIVFVAAYLLFLQLSVYLVIKYLSIYHSTVLQYEIDESQLIVRVRFVLFTIAIILVELEFMAYGVDQLIPYQVLVYGNPLPDGTHGTTFHILAFSSLLLLILLHSRIEYDKFVVNKAIKFSQLGLNQVVIGGQPDQQLPVNAVLIVQPQHKVKPKWIQFGGLFGTIYFFLMFVLIPLTTLEVEFKMIILINFLILFHCVIPIMYILSCPNVKSFTIILLKSKLNRPKASVELPKITVTFHG